jgi:aspartate/methionine/tyrosine aminotransferase
VTTGPALGHRTLTDRQISSLSNTYNLADGYARHQPHPDGVRSLVPKLPGLMFDLDGTQQRLAEREFLSTFYDLAGQTPPPASGLAFHYSVSVSIECAARALVDIGFRRVGLITPTIDLIPLLLRRAGLQLVPLEETKFWADAAYRRDQLRRCECLCLVVPNNPTGFEPDQATFLDAVGAAADQGLALMVDFSFRFYSRLHRWDQYDTIASSWPTLNAVFLEDTGKTWPTAELKVGFSCALGSLRAPLRDATREVLLNVSPFTLRVLTELINADLNLRRQSLADPHSCQVIAENRRELRQRLGGVNVVVDSQDSLVSVEWLRLPTSTGAQTCAWLEAQGVSVLPGESFYWDRSDGARHVRVALARSPAYFREAAAALTTLLRTRF